jgi:hypothetical protein
MTLNGNTRDVLILFGALLMGLSGTAGYQWANPPRPDPFTGAQGAALQRDIDRVEKELHALAAVTRNIETNVTELLVMQENLNGRLERVEE